MSRERRRARAGATGFIALATFTAPASAAQPFDGSWGIQVTTERGPCDPLYRYYIVIENNAVRVRSMMGEVSPEIAGRIQPSGRIDSRIGAADDPVSIRGRLEGGAGAGTWTASARQCAGRWTAEKRG
jgi:hypothetical protein